MMYLSLSLARVAAGDGPKTKREYRCPWERTHAEALYSYAAAYAVLLDAIRAAEED